MADAKQRKGTAHHDKIVRLRRIEGQVRGLQRMIEDDRYCIDILTQVRSAVRALPRVSDSVLERHLHHCVAEALASGSERDKEEKLGEVIAVLARARY